MAQQDVDPSANIPAYQESFVGILNNRAKVESGGEARHQGFVVITRGGTSLTTLQKLCSEQTYNHCLTARYRLLPAEAIGTLLAAFLKDLGKILNGRKDLAGGFMPEPSHNRWVRFTSNYLVNEDAPITSETSPALEKTPALLASLPLERGALTRGTVSRVFENLRNESVLARGHRLVLFGELSEPCTDSAEWGAAMDSLFDQLPERVGIVLSGAPADFHLPTGNPHFLELTLPADEGAKSSNEGQASYKYTDSSFHADEPAKQDELDVNSYANAIARFIVHPQTKAPLTIGINGQWGKGKSSFMRLVDSALIKYAEVNRNDKTRLQHWDDLANMLKSSNPGGKTGLSPEELAVEHKRISDEMTDVWKLMEKEAKRNVVSLTFNAWQFEDAKQTWAGLASQISETIESSFPWHVRQQLKLSYAWKERKSELILSLLLPLAVVLMVAGMVYAGFFARIGLGKPEGLALLLPTGSVLLTIWFVSSQLLKVAVPVSERVLSYVRMPNYREQMGFQHRVRDDLKFIQKFLVKHRPGCRVVVYIDDLDRCSENKIMELLQAINLILASSEFFVFVGMDTEMIYRAIRSYYKDTPTERSPESYLRKIVQISFYLPETASQKRADYVNTLFSQAARLGLATQTNGGAVKPQEAEAVTSGAASGLPYNLENVLRIIPIVKKEAEDTADELQAFRDYSDYLDDNPREIKRLINIHRLIKILVQQPDSSWAGERQRKLVKWLIFCDRWPHLVDDVLDLKNKPPSIDVLSELVADLTEEEKNNKGTGPSTPFDGLQDFAEHSGEKIGPGPKSPPLDPLLFQDIDAEFRLAANLSQLISKSPVGSAKAKPLKSEPSGVAGGKDASDEFG